MRYRERLRHEVDQVGSELNRTPLGVLLFISLLALLLAATINFGGLHL